MSKQTNNTANEVLKLVVLKDKFEKRMDYTTIHSIQWHFENLARETKKLTDAARRDGFKEEEIESMLTILEIEVTERLKSENQI